MAQSPSHRFGQIIGEVLESAIHPILEAVAKEHALYLDAKCPRKARGGKCKVSWTDGKKNVHDLDYVLEAGGSNERIGTPKAFIEIAWRRYTKHSRNKAQEIQGAIVPLAEHFEAFHPFLGAVLAGEFTKGSLDQLKSHGFKIVYFPYDSVVRAFDAAGIDARFDEDTSDAALRKKIKQYERLKSAQKLLIPDFLRALHKGEIDEFIEGLRICMTRTVSAVYVLPLHGFSTALQNVQEAISFIEHFDESTPCDPFTRYEVGIRYSNGDEIRGQFGDKSAAIAFLRGSA